MRGKKATAFLANVIRYIHGEGQKARTQDEHEDFTVALHILNAIWQGWTEPVLVAYYYAFGVHPDKYRRKRLERHAHMAWELSAGSLKPRLKLAKLYQMPSETAALEKKRAARGR